MVLHKFFSCLLRRYFNLYFTPVNLRIPKHFPKHNSLPSNFPIKCLKDTMLSIYCHLVKLGNAGSPLLVSTAAAFSRAWHLCFSFKEQTELVPWNATDLTCRGSSTSCKYGFHHICRVKTASQDQRLNHTNTVENLPKIFQSSKTFEKDFVDGVLCPKSCKLCVLMISY